MSDEFADKKFEILTELYAQTNAEARWWRDRSWSAFQMCLTIQLALVGVSVFRPFVLIQGTVIVAVMLFFVIYLKKAEKRYYNQVNRRNEVERSLRMHDDDFLTAGRALLRPVNLDNDDPGNDKSFIGTPAFVYTSTLVTLMLIVALSVYGHQPPACG
jgi:hypothetical protein